MSDVAERVKKIVIQHLGVDAEKVVDNADFIDDLGADLMELTFTTRLGTLGTKESPRVINLDRQLPPIQIVFNNRAHHSCGSFGAKSYRSTSAVQEGVHLFLDYICRFTYTSGKELSILKDG